MITAKFKHVKPQWRSRKASFLTIFLYRPRKLLLRRALFQVHLWTGLALVLYLVAIALSGAILVFKTELTAALLPRVLLSSTLPSTPEASVLQMVQAFTDVYPGGSIAEMVLPSQALPVYQISATDGAGHSFTLLADASATHLIVQGRTWLNWVYDLHYYLLLNKSYGMQVNGIGGGMLLACALSGLLVWWPGVTHWRRGFLISLRNRWRRINYDTHNAIGIWTLALVFWWAFSGLYFGWYRPIIAMVGTLSPLRGMVAPQLPVSVYTNAAPQRASLDTILAAIRSASPTGRLYSIDNATLQKPTLTADVDLRNWGDFSHRDLITVDAVTGRVLAVWHYGSNHTVGDWVLWAMHPIHFGTLWGLPVKILWFLVGISLAVLSITGVVMYWNRSLRHVVRDPRPTLP